MPIDAPVKQRKPKFKLQPTKEYGVVFHNNEKTTMDQVLVLLISVFGYDQQKAVNMVMNIHTNGKGVVYTSSRERCDMKNEETSKARLALQETNLIHTVEPL